MHTEAWGASSGGAAAGADLGGSSTYSNESFHLNASSTFTCVSLLTEAQNFAPHLFC